MWKPEQYTCNLFNWLSQFYHLMIKTTTKLNSQSLAVFFNNLKRPSLHNIIPTIHYNYPFNILIILPGTISARRSPLCSSPVLSVLRMCLWKQHFLTKFHETAKASPSAMMVIKWIALRSAVHDHHHDKVNHVSPSSGISVRNNRQSTHRPR